MIEAWKKYKWYVLTGLAVVVLVFLHFFKMTQIPYGLNVDEVAAAYDAYNIANYGVDRYLKSYPVYFTNYRDGQNALYIYITAGLFRLFGASKITIRVSVAVLAVAAAFFGYGYMAQHLKERQAKVIWLCLYAILPIFVMTQRFGLESHLLLPLSMAALFVTARALDTEDWRYYLAAGILLGITLYTYALTYIIIPVFLVFVLIYSFLLGKKKLKNILVLAVPLALLAAPLILVQAVNLFDLPEMYIGPFTITKLMNYRLEEVAAASPWQNIKNIFVNTFFFDDLSYNTIAKFGTMFYISVPFLLVGIGRAVLDVIHSVKEKRFTYSAPMLFWYVAVWIMGLFLTGNSTPNTTRMIGIFMPMLYFLVLGLYQVLDVIKGQGGRRIYAGAMGSLYLIGFLSFAGYYFTDYNEDAFPMKWLFYETYEEVGDFLEENQDAAWMDRGICYPWNYVYYLWEYKVNPYECNIAVNGIEQFGKDDINEYPEETLLENNYVVSERDQASMEYLKNIGYEEYIIGEKFRFYVSPLEAFSEEINQKGAQVSLDNMGIRENQLYLSGWCVDKVQEASFESLVVAVDGVESTMELLARPDVAEYLQQPDCVNNGFALYLPMDTLRTAEDIQLVGVREDGTKENIFSFSKK